MNIMNVVRSEHAPLAGDFGDPMNCEDILPDDDVAAQSARPASDPTAMEHGCSWRQWLLEESSCLLAIVNAYACLARAYYLN